MSPKSRKSANGTNRIWCPRTASWDSYLVLVCATLHRSTSNSKPLRLFPPLWPCAGLCSCSLCPPCPLCPRTQLMPKVTAAIASFLPFPFAHCCQPSLWAPFSCPALLKFCLWEDGDEGGVENKLRESAPQVWQR